MQETQCSTPGSGRSPGEGNGNPLQYSCLENSMDRGAWWATVHGVAKSWTRLSNFTLIYKIGNQQGPTVQHRELYSICCNNLYRKIIWKRVSVCVTESLCCNTTLWINYEVKKSESVSCSVVSDSLRPHRLQHTRLLCPWNFPGKNNGVGSYSLL